MPNGKGWLDCKDCVACQYEKPWENRFCNKFNFHLPEPESIDYDHTVCGEFEVKDSAASILNGEVVKLEDHSMYYIYKRGHRYAKDDSPQTMDIGVLYRVHYNEQALRPVCRLSE